MKLEIIGAKVSVSMTSEFVLNTSLLVSYGEWTLLTLSDSCVDTSYITPVVRLSEVHIELHRVFSSRRSRLLSCR